MKYSIVPRVKRAVEATGDFCFDALRVQMIGDGGQFIRTLKALMPDLPVEEVQDNTKNLTLSVATVFSAESEYCYLRILPDRMEIQCRDKEGARNAACILAQIIKRNGTAFSIPCGSVEDWPDAQYRGYMLESSGRVWMSMEDIYRYLRVMAISRLNVMLFHFMEFSGCTIQFDCYPDWHGYGEDNLKFTKQQIRDMIAYATELGIAVCPFVEVLSHSTTFNKAAGIACPGDTDEHMFAVCVGQEKTYTAIEKVLREVVELFPDPVLHIGGDEYDMSAVTPYTVHWAECPHCQALSKRMGYTTYRELFLYAVERVNTIVNSLGKVSMLWNADIKPGEVPELSRNIVMHFYRCDNTLGKEKHYQLWPDGYADDGFAVLNSYHPQTYVDVAKFVTANKLSSWSYLCDPRVSPRNHARMIGGCCCAWDDHEHFVRSIPATIILFADRFWNAKGDHVPFDENYGRAMTHALFEGQLPDDMNVFRAVGSVLPPLEHNVKAHFKKLEASIEEISAIKDALEALAVKDVPFAAIYADIAAASIDYLRENSQYEVCKVSVAFDG